MQVVVVALTKKGDVFPSNTQISVVEKLRSYYDIIDFKRIDLKKGFTSVFDGEFNYIALTDDVDYSGVLKALGNNYSNVKLLKYSSVTDEVLSKILSKNNANETYKLFNVSSTNLENFFV